MAATLPVETGVNESRAARVFDNMQTDQWLLLEIATIPACSTNSRTVQLTLRTWQS